MRFISKSIVTAVATMSVLALGASSASATITPSTGTLTATNTGSVVYESNILTNTCTTVDLHGDINMNNPTTQGGGGIFTAMTTGGCSPFTDVGDFTTPWTLNINHEVAAGTWTGTLTGFKTTRSSLCTFTGSLNVEYTNSTGRLSVTGGTLSGSPVAICGTSTTVTATWDLRSGATIPQVS
jgi:hypothetical protein